MGARAAGAEDAHHLGLRLPADRGQNLLNLVRAPEFVDYARQEDWPAPRLVRSDASNLKVTYPADLALAAMILRARK